MSGASGAAVGGAIAAHGGAVGGGRGITMAESDGLDGRTLGQ